MTEPDPQFEALLIYLKEARGFDFTGYKRSSLMRRVSRRMSQADIESYSDYLDHLQGHPDEFTALFNTILINVTGFFRDTGAWDHLRAEVLPSIVAGTGPIRIWSAGCASGQEAYTLAIVFAEELGFEEFRRRVKIYATDVDEDGLSHARQGSYSEREVADLSPEYIDRYFEPAGGRYTFRSDLRRAVIFGRNDLIQDAPISRVDLLLCRDTLMYFNAETQSRILARLHFALADRGILFLGKTETLLSHGDLFTPVDLKRRIFRKVPRHVPVNGPFPAEAAQARPGAELFGLDRVRSEAFLASPVAQIVVTGDGFIALSNRRAEVMFGVSGRDVGRPFRDLELSYRPVELRGYIEQAQVERRPQRVSDVEYARASGERTYLEIQVNPLVDSDSRLLGVVLVFLDVTEARRLRDELEHANRQVEAAYEELQSTNDELRDRTAELNTVNEFLEAVFVSLQAGVVVIGTDLQVRVWNRRCEDLWGVRAEEAVGQHFLNLDIGLPTDLLRPMIRQLLGSENGSQETRLPSVNRRGRQIEVRVVGTPLRRNGHGTTGVILVMDMEEPTQSVLGVDGRGTS